MSKTKLKLKDIKQEMDRNGEKYLIFQTEVNQERPICRECGKNRRADGSARCEGCSESYRKFKFDNARLQRKIEREKVEQHTKTN